ncbi:hypothetical protein [Methylobacterium nodulans]|uniref:Uncharacterized protein n=1 Tax=Methylobacterium nodulans (strain LMG 21967 / CNCM I-2342 / ORS 2060) TaxID=460265 RepID=B8IXE7_METNO|nr:hypothetical protein [Methylobacterium nodulans]ACL63188.1 hypothetical protein Mnod_8216 [Methylobacterium nodulans ORS 2060]
MSEAESPVINQTGPIVDALSASVIPLGAVINLLIKHNAIPKEELTQ